MTTENLLNPIRLHRPNRIKSMLFIQWLAVLVASYLSHRLYESLQLIEERKESKMNNLSSKSIDNKENSLSSKTTATPILEKQIDTSQQKEVSPRTNELAIKNKASPETIATPIPEKQIDTSQQKEVSSRTNEPVQKKECFTEVTVVTDNRNLRLIADRDNSIPLSPIFAPENKDSLNTLAPIEQEKICIIIDQGNSFLMPLDSILPYKDDLESETEDSPSLYDNVINGEVSGEILTKDGRLVNKPTFKIISDLCENITTKGYYENDVYKKGIFRSTPLKLLKRIFLMGFHPSIYIEGYSIERWWSLT